MNEHILSSSHTASVKLASAEIRKWDRIGLFIVIGILGGAVLWAALAPIASAVIANGVIKVDTSRKKIQHPEGGVVREILVRDGDRVKAGDTLVYLDKTRAEASFGVLQAGLDAALAQQARLIAERDELESIEFPVELLARRHEQKVADLIKSQTTQFKARKLSLDGQLSIRDNQIVFLQKGIEGLSAQQLAKEEQLQSLKTENAGLEELLAQGMVEKTKLRNIEREISRLEGERAEHISEIAKSRASIGEKELEKLQIRKSFREEVVESLRKVQTEINDSVERLAAAEHVLGQTDIKSPVDGTVVDLKVHTTGGVVGPGEVMLEIVPTNDRLVIEARVRPEDIDRVYVDLPAVVKLTAFDQRTTPELNGNVVYVSADIIEDPKAGVSYFTTKIEVPEQELQRLDGKVIQPGMTADVFVRTRDRTFMDYLLEPLIRSFNMAWREE
jgi:HlyD family type I secretion membrane fusion protein